MFEKEFDKSGNVISGTMKNDIVWYMNEEISNSFPKWMMWEIIGIKGLKCVNPFIQHHAVPITASATCDDRDEFDDSIGKAIVACKLDIKREERMAREYTKIADEIETMTARLFELAGNHMKKASAFRRQLERIEERIKELEEE